MTESVKRFVEKTAREWVEGGYSVSGYKFGLEEALAIKNKIEKIEEKYADKDRR